jgi:hypothetical protein
VKRREQSIQEIRRRIDREFDRQRLVSISTCRPIYAISRSIIRRLVEVRGFTRSLAPIRNYGIQFLDLFVEPVVLNSFRIDQIIVLLAEDFRSRSTSYG